MPIKHHHSQTLYLSQNFIQNRGRNVGSHVEPCDSATQTSMSKQTDSRNALRYDDYHACNPYTNGGGGPPHPDLLCKLTNWEQLSGDIYVSSHLNLTKNLIFISISMTHYCNVYMVPWKTFHIFSPANHQNCKQVNCVNFRVWLDGESLCCNTKMQIQCDAGLKYEHHCEETARQVKEGGMLEGSVRGCVVMTIVGLTVPCVLMNISKTLSLNKHAGHHRLR